MNTFVSTWWQVELPDRWIGSIDEVCATLIASPSIGALQVSAYRKNDAVTDADLLEFANEHIKNGAELSSEVVGDFTGLYLHFGVVDVEDTEDSYWRMWWLRDQTRCY
jgi:hypothetical protein